MKKPPMDKTARYAFAGIPNNRQGRAFITNVRKFSNPGAVSQIRTRGMNAKPGRSGRWGNTVRDSRTLRVYMTHDASALKEQRDTISRMYHDLDTALTARNVARHDAEHWAHRCGVAEGETMKMRGALATEQMLTAAAQMEAEKWKQIANAAQRSVNEVPAWILWLVGAWRDMARTRILWRART